MDEATFHDLYERHAPAVFRLARYLVGESDLAADITAETFFRAWAGREAIRVSTAKAYLLAIARNLATDEHRRRRRLAPPAENEPRADERAGVALELRETLEAMRRLPAAYREALALAASGVSYQDAAETLGVPLSTLKIRVYRARQLLAAAVQGGSQRTPGRAARENHEPDRRRL